MTDNQCLCASYLAGLREDLGRAEARIAELERRLHDHEQTVPHEEAQ